MFSIMLLIIAVISAIASAFVLNIAAKLLGARSSFFKALIVNFIVFLGTAYIKGHINFLEGALSFVFLLLVYKYVFDVGWIRALLIWLMQGILVALFIVLLIFFVLL